MAQTKTPAEQAKAVAEQAKAVQEKKEKFMDLAPDRVNRAVKAIGIVGNLSGKSYIYTLAQAEQIISALAAAVTDVRNSFAGKEKATSTFTFK